MSKTQYFDEVPAQVWEFYIGGYQVCQKWLKDRKGRTLALSDLRDYQKIVSAISEKTEVPGQVSELGHLSISSIR